MRDKMHVNHYPPMIRWWWPLVLMVAILVFGALGAAYIEGPIPTSKFGNVADWAEAFGAVTAVSLALLQRTDDRFRRSEARTNRQNRKEIEAAVDELKNWQTTVDGLASSRLGANDWSNRFRDLHAEVLPILGTLGSDEAIAAVEELNEILRAELPALATTADDNYLPNRLAEKASNAVGRAIESI